MNDVLNMKDFLHLLNIFSAEVKEVYCPALRIISCVPFILFIILYLYFNIKKKIEDEKEWSEKYKLISFAVVFFHFFWNLIYFLIAYTYESSVMNI